MLLGLDFLEANGVFLHLKEKELQIAGDVISMSLGTGSPLVTEKETGVFLAKGCKVPPNSVMRVGALLSESMAGQYIVKAATKGEILIPRTLHNGGDNPVLCLINLSDHYVKVGKGEVLAYAEEVSQMLGNFPFSILWTPLFRNLYFLYSNGLHVRTHLFCIGQYFPLSYFYIVIR
jgi:hypothetical protein